jgi:hypothetical protein
MPLQLRRKELRFSNFAKVILDKSNPAFASFNNNYEIGRYRFRRKWLSSGVKTIIDLEHYPELDATIRSAVLYNEVGYLLHQRLLHTLLIIKISMVILFCLKQLLSYI